MKRTNRHRLQQLQVLEAYMSPTRTSQRSTPTVERVGDYSDRKQKTTDTHIKNPAITTADGFLSINHFVYVLTNHNQTEHLIL